MNPFSALSLSLLLPSLKRNCMSVLPLGSFPGPNSHQLRLRIAGLTRDVKMAFWGQESSPTSSQNAGAPINHPPFHQHLSHGFGFPWDGQPNLGPVSIACWFLLSVKIFNKLPLIRDQTQSFLVIYTKLSLIQPQQFLPALTTLTALHSLSCFSPRTLNYL